MKRIIRRMCQRIEQRRMQRHWWVVGLRNPSGELEFYTVRSIFKLRLFRPTAVQIVSGPFEHDYAKAEWTVLREQHRKRNQ